jgi:hypothetical protein
MEEPTGLPFAWKGEKVHLEYVAGDSTGTDNGTLEEITERGVWISEETRRYFYPWSSVVRIGLGHKKHSGTRTTRIHR